MAHPMTAWREVVERTAKALQSAQARVIHEAQDEAARALGVSYPYYEDDRVPTWEDIGDAEREMYRRTADATLRALARPAGGEGGDMADDARESMARSLYEACGRAYNWPNVQTHWPNLVPALRAGWYAAADVALQPRGAPGGEALGVALRAWVLRRLAVIARDFPETAQSIDDIAGALTPTPAAQPPARAEGQPEGEHVARLAALFRGAHYVNIMVRRNGKDELHQGEWLKAFLPTHPPGGPA